VRNLQLLLRPWGKENENKRRYIALAVLDCLKACTRLQQLRLEAGSGAASGSAGGPQLPGLLFAATWKLPGLRQHLQHASFFGGHWSPERWAGRFWGTTHLPDDALPKGMQRLGALQSLELDQVALPPGAHLPPSLTRLELNRLCTQKRLPAEVSGALLWLFRYIYIWGGALPFLAQCALAIPRHACPHATNWMQACTWLQSTSHECPLLPPAAGRSPCAAPPVDAGCIL